MQLVKSFPGPSFGTRVIWVSQVQKYLFEFFVAMNSATIFRWTCVFTPNNLRYDLIDCVSGNRYQLKVVNPTIPKIVFMGLMVPTLMNTWVTITSLTFVIGSISSSIGYPPSPLSQNLSDTHVRRSTPSHLNNVVQFIHRGFR